VPATTTTHASGSPVAPTSPYAVLRWLVLATFVVILNETIMVNAIPRLMVEFDVSARDAQWLSTAFMLTMATVIPVTGWLLQRVTTRTAFRLAMGTFVVGTLISAVAPYFWLLVTGRVVQAAGTAVMVPLLMTTLMTVVPERDRGRVMGNVALAISVAPALGPTVSGVVLQWASWRWLFGLVLPVAVLVSVLSLRKLTDVGEPTPGSLDRVSVVLAGLGFGGLVYGLSGLGETEAAVLPAQALVAAGLLTIGLFVARQRRLQRRDVPLLDLRTLAHRTFTVALALQSVSFLAMLGSMILIRSTCRTCAGSRRCRPGSWSPPGGLAMGLLGPTVGRAFDRYGGRPLLVPGSVGVVVALLLMSTVGETTPYAVVLLAHLLLMVGLAATFTPAFTLGLGSLPPHLYSHGSSLLGTSQQVAAAIGTAVAVTVLSSRAATLVEGGASADAAFVGGMHVAFLAAAAIALVGVVLAGLLPSRVSSPEGRESAPSEAA
jgi:DHA2 family lincomycin resistance protein-like MFS transporter